MPSLLISRLASSTRASYPWTGAPRPPRDSSSAVKRVTSQGVALVPRWRRLGGSFGSYLVPPLAEGSPAHVFGPGCDEVLCSLVGKNVGGFVLLPLEDAPDGELYQLPHGVRVAQSVACGVRGLNRGRGRAASVGVRGAAGLQGGELI